MMIECFFRLLIKAPFQKIITANLESLAESFVLKGKCSKKTTYLFFLYTDKLIDYTVVRRIAFL